MRHILPFLRGFGTAIVATVLFALLVCGVVPLVVTGVGNLFFRDNATGQIVLPETYRRPGTVEEKSGPSEDRLSLRIGQPFASEAYFYTRPSPTDYGVESPDPGGAEGAGEGLAATSSNEDLHAQIFRALHELVPGAALPGDVYAPSASALDPDISVENALVQLPRVARVRNISEEILLEEIRRATRQPDAGIWGRPAVNVVEINLTLDRLSY